MARQVDGIDIKKLRAGEKKTLRQWFEKYADSLYTLVFHRVGRNADMAADIVQETFLIALKKIESYEPARGSMFVWLSYLSKNCIKKALREKNRYAAYQPANSRPDGTLLEACMQIATQPLPEDILEQVETAELVRVTLGSIPARYRDLLRQYYYQQKSVREISESRRINVGAVRTLLYRARASFKRTFLSLAKSSGDTFLGKGRQNDWE